MLSRAWLQAALVALPHITDLVKSSRELLNKNKIKKTDDTLDASIIDTTDPQALAAQLARVTQACGNNAESIQLLAEQMKNQLEHANKTVQMLDKRLRRASLIALGALLIAALALAKVLGVF